MKDYMTSVFFHSFMRNEHISDPEQQICIFTALVTIQVFDMSGALEGFPHEKVVNCSERLFNQMLEGLTLPEGFCPDLNVSKDLATVVLSDLEKQFEGQDVKQVLLMDDPDVQATILQCFKKNISNISQQPREEPYYRLSKWLSLFGAVLGIIMFITAITLAVIG